MRKLLVSTAITTLAASAVIAPAAMATAAPAPTAVTPAGTCKAPPNTKVSDLTINQLRQYVLNNGEEIPTLAEYLAYANSVKVGVLPEIKNWKTPASGMLPELADYTKQMVAANAIPTKIIGSFDPTILQYFKDNASSTSWPRVWFRGAGPVSGTNIVQPLAPPTVAEMHATAPAANNLGVINIGYFKGKFPLDGKTYNVPAQFYHAKIPVYIWYNVATKGDGPANGPSIFGVPSPGWNSITAMWPKNVKWIATDRTARYKAWTGETANRPIPEMVAHRGGGIPDYSENSMSAFRQAVRNGAHVLETDVQWTKPLPGQQVGTAVLMHDQTINRTTKCAPSKRPCPVIASPRQELKIAFNGTTQVAYAVRTIPGCTLHAPVLTRSPIVRGDLRYVTATFDPATGATWLTTYGAGSFYVRVTWTATPNPGNTYMSSGKFSDVWLATRA